MGAEVAVLGRLIPIILQTLEQDIALPYVCPACY
jgi:hypothetical protein